MSSTRGNPLHLWTVNFSSDDSRPASAAGGPPPMEPAPPQAIPPPPSEQAAEPHEEPQPPLDQTSLIQNEEESFALAPVDASALKGETSSGKLVCVIVGVWF